MGDVPVLARVEHRVVLAPAAARRSSPPPPPSASPAAARRTPSSAGTSTRSAARPGCRTVPPTPAPTRTPSTPSPPGRNGARCAATATGPTPGPPPPCGMQNVLCRFRCDDVAAERARPGQPDQRVQVRPVDVDLPARVVHRRAHLADLGLVHAVRRRVGDHQRGQRCRACSSIFARRSARSTSPRLVGRRRRPPASRPSPPTPRWCRARSPGSGRRRGAPRRGCGGRPRSPAARPARPGCRRWAAATPPRSR